MAVAPAPSSSASGVYGPRGDKLSSFPVTCGGGLVVNKDNVLLGDQAPGSALNLINYEPSVISGGYRRIAGYIPHTAGLVPNFVDSAGTPVVSGALGPITGLNVYKTYTLAARKDYVYSGQEGDVSWVRLNVANPLANAGRVRFANYSFMGEEDVVFVAGVGKPLKWNGTGSATALTNAPSNAKYVCAYLNRLWFAGHTLNTVVACAPNTDTDYSAPNGAIEINVGNTITNIIPFRDTLYVFCRNAIYKIVGSSSADFSVKPVTSKLGCLYPDSIIELGGDLYFLASDGVRPISGTTNIGDVNLASVSKLIQPYAISLPKSADSTDYVVACAVATKTQYRLFVASAGIPNTATFGLLGGSPQQDGAFEWCKTLGISATAATQGFINGVERVFHGNYDGYVYQQESGDDFSGTSIQSRYTTPAFAMGDPYIRKVLHKIKLYAQFTGATDIIIAPSLDLASQGILQPGEYDVSGGGSSTVYDSVTVTYDGTSTYDDAPVPVLESNLEGSFFVVGFDFVCTGGPVHEINGFTVDYMRAGRR